MTLLDAREGEEYIIQKSQRMMRIWKPFCFLWAATAENPLP